MKDIEYHTLEKRSWGFGPWLDEPDKAQWSDPSTGLPCLAVRSPLGVWCGYVGVSRGHPLWHKEYESCDVDVHGGLTFSDRCQDGEKEKSICHIVEAGEDDDIWWFGFDCAHCWDYVPSFKCLQDQDTYYKTLAYVKNECAKLAKQLKEI